MTKPKKQTLVQFYLSPRPDLNIWTNIFNTGQMNISKPFLSDIIFLQLASVSNVRWEKIQIQYLSVKGREGNFGSKRLGLYPFFSPNLWRRWLGGWVRGEPISQGIGFLFPLCFSLIGNQGQTRIFWVFYSLFAFFVCEGLHWNGYNIYRISTIAAFCHPFKIEIIRLKLLRILNF